MKGLSLTQPWATLVAIGAKRIETRIWATSYRGPLAIHAAKGLGPVGGKKGLVLQCARKHFLPALDLIMPDHLRGIHSPASIADRLPLGAIATLRYGSPAARYFPCPAQRRTWRAAASGNSPGAV